MQFHSFNCTHTKQETKTTHNNPMAAVILVLAEDIGDTYRGSFVDAVVRAIDTLTNEDDNVAMNPQSGAPALTVT